MSWAPSPETLEKIEEVVRRYPQKGAALLPVLHLLQKDTGFISPEAEKWAAGFLGVPPIRVREVLSFYTLFRRAPVGRHVIQVCRNLRCALAGADDILDWFKRELGISPGDTTPDGKFTLLVAECLGNCDHAPCLMVDDDDHGPVTVDRLGNLLKGLE